MAGNSLLTLLDDIATVLDDVALMTKMAAKKTSGVLGDDLALNAQQVAGVRAEREIPVVMAVAKGSLINKCILVPLALLISAFAPWLITPLLMLGGAFLCYEGAEKLTHKFFHKAQTPEVKVETEHSSIDIVQFEKNKIKGAIRTDFILSAEIIVITLGTLSQATFAQQVLVLCIIAIAMTIGVYGLVAGIVRLDDCGFYLIKKTNQLAKTIGHFLLKTTPYLMKTLAIVGTIAMFMVGGGILTHGVSLVAHFIHDMTIAAQTIPSVGTLISGVTPTLLNMLFGILAGFVILAIIMLISKLKTSN